MATPTAKRPAAKAKKPAAKTASPKSVDDYLAGATADQRAALQRLRRTIKAAAPKATEGLSYGIVGFKLAGKPLAYYGYAKAHCGLYGLDSSMYAKELKAYEVSKGTIRFTPDKPLPDRLVTKMVRARAAAIEQAG